MATDDQNKQYWMVVFKRLLRSLARTGGRMADQSGRKQAEEMRRAAATQAGIVQVLQELPSLNADLQAVMSLMAERARGLTGASGGLIELIEDEHLVCRAAAGIPFGPVGRRLKRSACRAMPSAARRCRTAKTAKPMNGWIAPLAAG